MNIQELAEQFDSMTPPSRVGFSVKNLLVRSPGNFSENLKTSGTGDEQASPSAPEAVENLAWHAVS